MEEFIAGGQWSRGEGAGRWREHCGRGSREVEGAWRQKEPGSRVSWELERSGR